jgi:Leucine Rich repeat
MQYPAYPVPPTAIRRVDFSYGHLNVSGTYGSYATLTRRDARFIFEYVRQLRHENLVVQSLSLHDFYFPRNDNDNTQDDAHAIMSIFYNGILSACPSLTRVSFYRSFLGNKGVSLLMPAFLHHITSCITAINLGYNDIQGDCGGGDLIRDLLIAKGCTLLSLALPANPQFGAQGARGLGQGIFHRWPNHCVLQELYMGGCSIGNQGLANMLLVSCSPSVARVGDDETTAMTERNTSLTHLDLMQNEISGEEGGRLVGVLLQRFQNLLDLNLWGNPLENDGLARLLPPRKLIGRWID